MKTKKGQQSNKKKMPADYNKLPTKILQKEFNQYIKPYLSKGKRGPKPKISFYKTFNYILYVLHTGIQWEQLKPYHNEIHWTNVYRHHNRWSKDGSYQNLFYHSIKKLRDHDKLDLSILHGDSSNTLAKKGAKKSVIPGINIRKAKKS